MEGQEQVRRRTVYVGTVHSGNKPRDGFGWVHELGYVGVYMMEVEEVIDL